MNSNFSVISRLDARMESTALLQLLK